MNEFDVYIVHWEPRQNEKVDAMQTAIGLKYVEGRKFRLICLTLRVSTLRATLPLIRLVNVFKCSLLPNTPYEEMCRKIKQQKRFILENYK